jgi:hypothetical protein
MWKRPAHFSQSASLALAGGATRYSVCVGRHPNRRQATAVGHNRPSGGLWQVPTVDSTAAGRGTERGGSGGDPRGAAVQPPHRTRGRMAVRAPISGSKLLKPVMQSLLRKSPSRCFWHLQFYPTPVFRRRRHQPRRPPLAKCGMPIARSAPAVASARSLRRRPVALPSGPYKGGPYKQEPRSGRGLGLGD